MATCKLFQICITVAAILTTACTHAGLIRSDEVTNWGTWAETVARCPQGTFVQGFQLKVENWIGAGFDDSSLNGIRLYCGNPVEENVPFVESLVGSWGKWRNLYRCGPKDYITGFQLRVEKPGLDLDETATNNVRFFCHLTTNFVEGDGERWGSWGDVKRCPANQAVCGIQTQVQEDRGVLLDDTALNNIALECCDLPPDAAAIW